MSKLNILFVCGRNQWRSPTAEHLYRNDQRFRVRSAGIAQKSRKTVSQNDIEWASLILVMEQKHATAIRSRFRDFELPTIKILEIPDEYHFMEPELIELIQEGTEALLHDFSTTEDGRLVLQFVFINHGGLHEDSVRPHLQIFVSVNW